MITQFSYIFNALSFARISREIGPDFYLILLGSIIIGIAVFYFYNKLKKKELMKALGFNKEQYNDYKQNCPLNHKNRFCMSDEWVINEYSYKLYHTRDIISASPTHKMAKGSKQYDKRYIYGIIIGYHGGTDSFTMNGLNERDRLLRNINKFIECRVTGKNFVQDNFR